MATGDRIGLIVVAILLFELMVAGSIQVGVEQPDMRKAAVDPGRFFHASARLGGASLGRLALGRHLVVVTLEGYEAVMHEIDLTAGRTSSAMLSVSAAGGGVTED